MPQEYFSGMGSARPFVQAVGGQKVPRTAPISSKGSCVDIPSLNALALRSLVSLFEAKESLFCRCAAITKDGFHQERTSRKRTIIALLGLRRLEQSGASQPFDLGSIRNALLKDTAWVKGVADLGLLTWFTAEFLPERLPQLFKEFDFDKALETYPDGYQARTIGLAWFLAGLSHARLNGAGTIPDLTDVAADAYHLLVNNQGEDGIFGQAAYPGLLKRAFCNRFGTFGDQIYAIYALTTFAKAFEIEEPLESALNCGNSIRGLQGELGQWWFLYDKRACRVVNRYPVLSLHQNGTAPVGLLALGEATGQSFQEAVLKGLSWVAGANELRQDLTNLDRSLIWDSIVPKGKVEKYWEGALSFANISCGHREASLRIRYEARPDHFGWLLYAFGEFGLPGAAV